MSKATCASGRGIRCLHSPLQTPGSPVRAGARSTALRDWPATAVRESAEVITASAQALIIEREIEEAARLTARAYAVAAATGSARNIRAVTDLRVQLRPFRGTRAVRDLDERILTGN